VKSSKLYAIISDVHGNETAFAAVLEYIAGTGAAEIYCLGDLVGYGQGAAACVKMAQKHNVRCLQGNHDAQVQPPRDPRMRAEANISLDHALQQLSTSQVEWLKSLPISRVVDNHMILVHGALTGRDDYILTQQAIQENLALLVEKYPECQLAFFGHSHLALVAVGDKVRMRFPETDIVTLKPGERYLINPGSVGQPRDEVPLASFALYDAAESQVIIVRIAYDIEEEQRRMQRAGLPQKLWLRLALGK